MEKGEEIGPDRYLALEGGRPPRGIRPGPGGRAPQGEVAPFWRTCQCPRERKAAWS